MAQGALARVSSHERDVLVDHPTMGTALHWACCNDSPAHLLASLVDAHPGALLMEDSEGNCPLHAACRWDAPLDVVTLLIRAGRERCRHQSDGTVSPVDPCRRVNSAGRTPLHYSCDSMPPSSPDRLCPDAVRAVVTSYPDALFVRETDEGMTPLHLACQDGARNARVIEALLGALPTGALLRAISVENRNLCLPIHLFFPPFAMTISSYLCRIGSARGSEVRNKASRPENDLELRERLMLETCIRVMNLFLRDAQHSDLSCNSNKFQILHACCFAGWKHCPNIFLRLALRLYPPQLLERDRDGNLPLHLACGHNLIPDLGDSTSRPWRREVAGFTPVSFVPLIAEACPASLRLPDGRGRFPLHIAAESGLPWIEPWERQGFEWGRNSGKMCAGALQILFKAYPQLATTRDVKTGLYPFMLAACKSDTTRTGSFEATNISCTDEIVLANDKKLGCEGEPSETATKWGDASVVVKKSSRGALVCDHALTATYELLHAAPCVLKTILDIFIEANCGLELYCCTRV